MREYELTVVTRADLEERGWDAVDSVMVEARR